MSTVLHIAPGLENLEPLLREIAADGVPPQAKVIYRARNTVYTLQHGELTLNIKAFKKPGLVNSLVYGNFRDSKARRSMRNATRLTQMGIGTPAPVAYVENRRGPFFGRSYYVTLQLQARDMRLWADRPDAADALPAMARFLAGLHRKGVWHKDFSPGNILWQKDAGGQYRFFLIDLNRMRFAVADRRKLMRNLFVVYIENPSETRRFARLYAAAAGIGADKAESIAAKGLDRWLKRKARLKKIKRIFGKKH